MATATVFVPDCLRIFRSTQGVSLRSETLLISSVESSEWPRSPMVMVRPSRLSTVMASISSHAADAAHHAERVFRRADLHRTAGHLEVLGRQGVGHVGHRQAVGAELHRVQDDVDLPRLAADEHHLPDAVNGLQLPPQHLVAVLGDVAERGRRRRRDGDRPGSASRRGPSSRRSAARRPGASRAGCG